MTVGVKLRNVTFKFAVAKFYGIAFGNNARKFIDAEYLFHYVNTVGLNNEPNAIADSRGGRALNFNFVSSALYEYLIMNTLENNGSNLTAKHTVFRRSDLYVFGTNDDVYGLVFFKTAVKTGKALATKPHLSVLGHNARENIAFADEIGDERVFGLVINHFRRTDLLDCAVRHNHDCVRHRQCFFLIVRNVNKGDAQAFVHRFEFKLHFLAHFEIERAERLVQKQNFRLVHDCACDGDTLLLTAGKGRDGTFFKAAQIHDFKCFFYFFGNNTFGELFHLNFLIAFFVHVRRFDAFLLQTERNVFKNVEMGEKRIFLEYGIDGSAVGG